MGRGKAKKGLVDFLRQMRIIAYVRRDKYNSGDTVLLIQGVYNTVKS